MTEEDDEALVDAFDGALTELYYQLEHRANGADDEAQKAVNDAREALLERLRMYRERIL